MKRALTLGLALTALLASCGGDDGGAAEGVPEGWKVTEGEGYAFAHPPGWEVRRKTVSTGEPVVELVGPRGTAQLPPNVVVGSTPNYGSGLEGALEVKELSAKVRYPSREVVSRKDIEVPGAEAAKLIEGTFDNAGTPVRTFDVVAISEDRTAVNMFARVPAADVERSGVRQVLDSLTLRP